MRTRHPSNNLEQIKHELSDRAEDLFLYLYGKPTTRRGDQLRWGRKESLALYLRGRNGPRWHDYEAAQGGDMLAFIQHALCLDFAGALDWARDFLGYGDDDDRPRPARHRPPSRKQPVIDYDKELADKASRVADLVATLKPIAGTLAEHYLIQHRDIDALSWPNAALGFVDAETVKRCTGWWWWRWAALVVKATNAAGVVTGLQLIAIEADGQAAKRWNSDGKLKQTYGILRETAVRLSGDERALLLCEGPETALSCWWSAGIETWATLGSIARAPLDDVPINRPIVVCADDDPRHAPANKALRQIIRKWRGEGRSVLMVKPWRFTRRDKSDFNDLLRADGFKAVRDRILGALDDRPVLPCLPNIEEVRPRAADMVDSVVADLLLWTRCDDDAPFKVVRVGTGIGKTGEAIRRALAAAARGAKVIYLVPTHRLGAELVGRVKAEAQLQGVIASVDTWRGRGSPDKPEEALCAELDTIALAQAAKADTAALCKICPGRGDCAYLAQFERRAQIWIGAHDLLWHAMPPPLKGADLVVIDEGFATRGLTGLSDKPRLITEAELEVELMPARDMLIAALRDHPPGGLRRDRLIEAGLTVEAARTAQRFEWDAKARIDLAQMSWEDAKWALAEAAKRNRMIMRFAALWHAVDDLLAEDGSQASGRAVVGDFKVEETTVRAVRLFGAERIAADWRRTPTLHIDATVNMRLLRCRVPHAELVGKVEAAAPHMRVVQYPDRAFGKRALRNERFLFKAWDWCVAYVSRRGGDWGVILPKEAEDAILAAREVPGFIKLYHFGKLRGLDELRNARGLIVVGRPMAKPRAVEQIAGAVSGRMVESIAGGWYPAEMVQIRARDGSVATVEADRHPNPLAEEVRKSITEDELIQAIGRVRGLNRTAKNPVEVVLLSNVPVPGVMPDELRAWEGPTIDDELLSRCGAVLECAGDAAKVAGLTLRQVKDRRRRVWAF
jgi:putative DNA primase/helicase